MKFIIEHLDKKLYKWSLIEYTHISGIVGKSNLIFTNIKGEKTKEKLEKLGKVKEKSVKELKLKNTCILDPFAEHTLSTKDCKTFDYLILGGVLGDHPPKKRTEEELTSQMNCQSRNLGEKQMSTDTAAYVSWLISRGKDFREIHFIEGLEIETGKNESAVLPFRYVVEHECVVIPKKIIELLKKGKGF